MVMGRKQVWTLRERTGINVVEGVGKIGLGKKNLFELFVKVGNGFSHERRVGSMKTTMKGVTVKREE